MKSLRLAACAAVVGSVCIFSGCSSLGIHYLSPAEYDQYQTLGRLNKQQELVISTLTNDKERLTSEVAALKGSLGDKGALLAAQEEIIKRMQSGAQATGLNPDEAAIGMNKYGEVVVDMKGDILFSSGESKLKSSGEKVLTQVAEILAKEPNKLAICGYTDSDPIKRSHWESNYQLSGARALAVLNFLEKQGIPAEKMHFRGYGEYGLKYDDSGKESKAKSRRAEIVLLKESSEPVPAATDKPDVVVPK